MTGVNKPIKSVVVVGSINMDLVVRSERLPRPGETLIGRDFDEIPGGKGANQAVAAARLGASVTMIGRVGSDAFGETLRRGLESEHVHVQHVLVTAGVSSGVAVIGVEDSGQNCITVVPGANGRLMPEDLSSAEDVIRVADVMLLQLEIPVTTVLAAIDIAHRHGIRIILDPAPAVKVVPPHLLEVDLVCPNETEAEMLTGISVRSVADAARAAKRLQQLGATEAIITLGDRGALFCDRNGVCELVEPCCINAVDTTASGDAFAAALGLRIAEGADLRTAVQFACAAGAVAACREGAQQAMPIRADVESMVNRQ
ncbi:MAG: ribokinase [Planctomyces sp.]|nr:ribokinase [Planctomyces sp.]